MAKYTKAQNKRYNDMMQKLYDEGYMQTDDNGKSAYLTRHFISQCRSDLNETLTRLGLKGIYLSGATIQFQYADSVWSDATTKVDINEGKKVRA